MAEALAMLNHMTLKSDRCFKVNRLDRLPVILSSPPVRRVEHFSILVKSLTAFWSPDIAKFLPTLSDIRIFIWRSVETVWPCFRLVAIIGFIEWCDSDPVNF